jgi:beta-phosphoglucomutase-like phosphatase (HAD superfamily)
MEFMLALASSASRREVELVTKEFGVDALFSVITTGEDVVHGKPDPEPYVLTAKKLGLQPFECVAIEDSSSGLQSAKSAGCHCIAIYDNTYKSDATYGRSDSRFLFRNYSKNCTTIIPLTCACERDTGVEPVFHPWEGCVGPLN